MKKLFILLTLLFTAFVAKCQTQPFGVVDTADLKLTSCDFEKDANAMVLFDKADAYYRYATVVVEHHKRIKIFNDKGNNQAKVRIEYYGVHNDEVISGIEAQTINLKNNAIEYTPVDKSLIYKQNVDKERIAIVFTFPNVKPGSIIEFKYKWSTPYASNFPDWFFQEDVPTRYSEFQTGFSNDYTFKFIKKVNQKLSKDTSFFKNGKNNNQGVRYIWAMTNAHSLGEEPYMPSIDDNIQGILFQVTSRSERTWNDVISDLLRYDDFGAQLDPNISLNDQDKILAKVNTLQTQDEKITYIFNLVKNSIAWNNFSSMYTDDGIKRAWNKKTGNAAEVNIILYHFLKMAGINVYSMAVNTKNKIEQRYASRLQLNKVVDYIRVDSTKQYVLDATNKYNVYNQMPFYLLNSNGIIIDPEKKMSRFISLQNISPTKNVVFVNAEIMPDGKMTGTAQINSFSYNKMDDIKRYKDDGEKKYIDGLRDNDNNLTILSLKLENMEVDSLPLTQSIGFKLDLTGSDDNYIYFNPNLFTGLSNNPFLSKERLSNIDFKYLNNYTISGRYKVPQGYKIEALPKSMTILMPDTTIKFKRIVAEQEGYIMIYYVIDFKKSYYLKEDYPPLFAFYKRMHEMLNEQIILKKS
ncbi:MAG: hypothetical protein JWQ66_1202 [Mucilaginibacter sp.]|nr:hypothetical protein [Mucilaginibacter sp.]